MKTCVIMQPTYLPWLGYFDLIKSADVFVFLDHAQFSKQSWQQRNRVRDKNGELMLTIPVTKSSSWEKPICQVEIDHAKKPLIKHIKSIKSIYGKALNFSSIYPELENIYGKNHKFLAELNIELIKFGCKEMGIATEMVRSSTLGYSKPKVEGIIEICKHFNCQNYLSPVGSKEYIEENDIFTENGINLAYQNYTHITYEQMNYSNFISHLSFIDYLFNKK